MRRQQVPVKAPIGSPGGSPELSEDIASAALAKALGHPARIGIVSMLHERQTCIGCDIVEEIGLAQSTTSEHLRVLKAAGIISGEIERPRVCYSLNPTALEPLRHFLNKLAGRPAAKNGSEQGPE
jgi:ArsR family transcriptional regulator